MPNISMFKKRRVIKMLYEKKYKKKISYFLQAVIVLCIVLLSLTYTTCGLLAIQSLTVEKIKITDVFNTIAQIATAFAFFFAVYQYRKNGEKERQIIIANEAKLLIDRMSHESDKLASNAKFTDREVNEFISIMSNFGCDFKTLYDELTDDLHKAMVRMRWQDMHYNHLSIALSSLTIDLLFDNLNLDKKHDSYSFFDARFDDSTKSQPKVLREYMYTKNIFNNMSAAEELINSFTNLYLFEQYYFDHEGTNDLMYGLLSRLDFRVSAPLLSVIKEKQR